jgi:periplasmic protein CpxP/Spy
MNNTRYKTLLFAVAILLITNIAMLVYFTGSKHQAPKQAGRGDRPGSVTSFLKNDIAFSKEQLENFDSLKKQHRTDIKPYFDALAKSKDSFYQLLNKTDVSDSILKEAAAVIGKNQAALDLHFFQNFKSIRTLCTPDQLPKFDSLMPAVAARMMEPWRKNGPRRGDSTRIKP